MLKKVCLAVVLAASAAGAAAIVTAPAKDPLTQMLGPSLPSEPFTDKTKRSENGHADGMRRSGQLEVVLYDEDAQQSLGPMSRREAQAWKSAYPKAEVIVPDEEGRYHAQGWLSFEMRYAAAAQLR